MKKKWFFIILILAVVGVVLAIVFINLFREKDTKQLAENVNNVTESGYLYKENESNKKIDEYLVKLRDLNGFEEVNEVTNYYNAYLAFEVMGEFFDREIVFTKYTDVYKNNRKPISDAFGKAQKAADEMANYIKEQENKVQDSIYWLSNSWVESKKFMVEIYTSTTDAMNKLCDVYTASMPSKLLNNDLSSLIFDTYKDLSTKLTKEQEKEDTKEIVVKFSNDLHNFVSAYLTVEGEENILKYNYSKMMQDKVKDIKEKKTAETPSVYYEDFLNGRIAG